MPGHVDGVQGLFHERFHPLGVRAFSERRPDVDGGLEHVGEIQLQVVVDVHLGLRGNTHLGSHGFSLDVDSPSLFTVAQETRASEHSEGECEPFHSLAFLLNTRNRALRYLYRAGPTEESARVRDRISFRAVWSSALLTVPPRRRTGITCT